MYKPSVRFLALAFLVSTLWSCQAQTPLAPKINGVSFVASPQEFSPEQLQKPQQKVAANAVSIMPYGYVSDQSKVVQFNSKWQWWGERIAGSKHSIQMAKDAGYQVMVKPQIWIRHGAFTGHHAYDNDADWQKFETSYRDFILTFAAIADSMQADLFCIGTEWEYFVEARPAFWTSLIKAVKEIYKGPLTYAANWDEYQKTPFWNELDYIGVDAYFPLIEDKTPSSAAVSTALLPYKTHLKELTERFQKKILFTEYGYRSRDKTAYEPWDADRSGEVNIKAQVNSYKGFYQTFWQEEFIAGGFIWKWFHNYKAAGGTEHNGFTPQNKAVESVIFSTYSKSNL
ncbi:MAG: glycoside hydrolase [Verrucomicrobia bacterium]|nr:glycoside hydrolase [Verrucomicrobiota bacterium]|tara:strand:- start:238 stop:1263 length:1026 start_codon:yes stop_codon:yes gene_type:complete